MSAANHFLQASMRKPARKSNEISSRIISSKIKIFGSECAGCCGRWCGRWGTVLRSFGFEAFGAEGSVELKLFWRLSLCELDREARDRSELQ